jgi:hypothetical protein
VLREKKSVNFNPPNRTPDLISPGIVILTERSEGEAKGGQFQRDTKECQQGDGEFTATGKLRWPCYSETVVRERISMEIIEIRPPYIFSSMPLRRVRR